MITNERLKQLRKLLGLTQNEFGERIGVTGDTISVIEKGKNNLTNRNISLICEKFNVDEIWLRTGEGEPFREKTEGEKIAGFLAEVLNKEDDDITRKIVAGLARLDRSQWDALEGIIDTMLGKQKEGL